MLKIIKGNPNNLIVTFSEGLTPSAEWILLQFRNEMLPTEVVFTLLNVEDNLSTSPRYDIWTIYVSDDGDANPLESQIKFGTNGNWSYIASELDTSNGLDLEDLIIRKQVQIGLSQISGEETELHPVYK